MSRLEDVGYKPTTNSAVVTSATNAIGTVTIAAPGPGLRVYVLGYSLSYNLAVATAHAPDIVSGSLVVDRLQIPAAAVSPIVHGFGRGVECPTNTSVVITVPAAGTSVVSTIVVRYFIA